MKVTNLKQHALLLMLFVSSTATGMAFAGEVGGSLPTGKDIGGGVEFDVVIVVNAPIVGSHIAIFGHYWVTADRYRSEYYWTEPSWMATNFYYPPSLTITDDKSSFCISHKLWDKRWAYKKPLAERGPFGYICNVYPVNDIRFAAQEAAESRLFLRDVVATARDRATLDRNGQRYIEVRKGDKRFGLHWKDKRLVRCELYRGEDLVKVVDYQYDSAGLLHKQTVRLVQHNILVGDENDSPHRIQYNQQLFEFKYLPFPYHAGDRLCEVEYRPVGLNGTQVALPVSVVVRGPDRSAPLRSIRFYDYKYLPADNTGVFDSNDLVYGFDENYTRCKKLYVRKKWRAATKNHTTYTFSSSELDDLRAIYETFLAQFANASRLWERLKLAKMLCQTAIMLETDDDALSWAQTYFECLHKFELNEMIIKSGLDLCKTLGYWQDADFLSKFIPVWVRCSLRYNSLKEMVPFFERSMMKQCSGHGRWYLYLFLNEVASRAGCDAEAALKYELSYFKSMCILSTAQRMYTKKTHRDIDIVKMTYDNSDFVRTLEQSVQETLRLASDVKLVEDKSVKRKTKGLREYYGRVKPLLPR